MYAHQVIENLRKLSTFAKSDEMLKLHINKSIRAINEAEKFHLGDYTDMYSAFKNNIQGKQIFLSPEVSTLVRLPYETCWFDFENTGPMKHDADVSLFASSKRGVLAEEVSSDSFILWVFSKADDEAFESWPNLKKRGLAWLMSGVAYFFIIGKKITPNEAVKILESSNKHTWLQKIMYSTKSNVPSHMFCFPTSAAVNSVINSDLLQQQIKDDTDDFGCLNTALMLLNCRNIETIDNPPPDKLNKKRIKSGKQPLFTYKTLVIKPTGKQQQSGPRHLWENRIHLCRGHFKTYTEDAPLFGRLTGRYWWQPSVRGRNRDGVVMKDYRVEA